MGLSRSSPRVIGSAGQLFSGTHRFRLGNAYLNTGKFHRGTIGHYPSSPVMLHWCHIVEAVLQKSFAKMGGLSIADACVISLAGAVETRLMLNKKKSHANSTSSDDWQRVDHWSVTGVWCIHTIHQMTTYDARRSYSRKSRPCPQKIKIL